MVKQFNKMLAFLLCLVMVVSLMPASFATATGNNSDNIENAEAFDGNLENSEALDGDLENAEALDGNLENSEALDGNLENSEALDGNLENAEALDGDLENAEALDGDLENAKALDGDLSSTTLMSLLANETPTPSATIFGTPELGSNDPLWAQTKEYLINKSTVPSDSRPHATGTVRILWDYSYLYARVVVEDSSLYQGPGGDHQYDSLEFYVGSGSGGSNQWRVSATGVFSGQSAPGRAAWTQITDTGYIVEMRIPKRTLTLQEGKLTFEVYINNSTEKGGDRYEVVSSFGVPDAGYSSDASFTDSLQLTSANEADTRFSITATAGPGGTITPHPPGDVLRIAKGSSKQFTFTPDRGKIVDTVTVDGEAVTLAAGIYTFLNVEADHTIHVTFKNDPNAKQLPFIVWNDNFARGEYTTAVIIDLGDGKAALGSKLNPGLFTVSARNTTLNGDSVTFEGTRKITRVYANNEPKVRGYLGTVSHSPDYQEGLASGRYIVVEFEFYSESGGNITLDGTSNSTKQVYNIVQNDEIALTDGSSLPNVVFEQDKVVNPILDKFTTPTGNSVDRALYLHTDENGEVSQGLPLYVYIHGMGRGGTNSATDQKAAMKSANGAVALMKKIEENPGKYASHILNISYNGTSTPTTANVKKVIDELVASGAVDPNRIYVAGFSWGGQYTNSLVNAYPGFFAAAAPMSPVSGSPNASTNDAHKDLAYWMFINAYNVGVYQTNLNSFISTNMPKMINARASRFESNEALTWPYIQFDQPNQRPNQDNTPALGDQVAHEVEAAVLYNQITMGTWSIAPIAQSSNLSTWNNDYTDVFDWMFAQKKPHVPSAPGGFSATAGGGQVTLSWTAPADDGGSAILGYKVWYDDVTPASLDAAATEYTFTGLTNGQVYTFKIVAVNAKGDSAETSATATPSVLVTGISLSTTSASITVGSSVTLAATVTPEDATNAENIIWTSNNTGVATVANGTITGISAGTAVITAKIGDITATCSVTVVSVSSNESGNGGNGGNGGNSTVDTDVPATTPPAIEDVKPEETTKPTDKIVTIADKTKKLIADKLLKLSADNETLEDIKALVKATTINGIMDSFKDIVKNLKDTKYKSVVEQAANLAMLKVGTIDISNKLVKSVKGVAKVQVTTDLAKQLLQKASLVAEIDKIIASYEKKLKTEVNFKKYVTLNIPTNKSDKSVYVGLSSATVKELSKKVEAITVSSSILEVDISLKASEIIKADTIAITASKASKVSEETKKVAGKNEVYTVTCSTTTGKKTSTVLKVSVASKITIPVDIKKFNTKTVTVKCVQNGKVVKTFRVKVDKTAEALVFDSNYFGDFIIVNEMIPEV